MVEGSFSDEAGADSAGIRPKAGVTLTHESLVDYQILYGNGFGIPDSSLDSTSTTGIVWVVPTDPEPTTHIFAFTMTDEAGVSVGGFAAMPRSVVALWPAPFQAGGINAQPNADDVP